jgi:hypothetical protein
VNLLQQHTANGLRFALSNYVESGEQVSVTFTVSAPQIAQTVNVTKVFTFRSGMDVVVQMNDGVDVLALRALQAQAEEDSYEDDE